MTPMGFIFTIINSWSFLPILFHKITKLWNFNPTNTNDSTVTLQYGLSHPQCYIQWYWDLIWSINLTSLIFSLFIMVCYHQCTHIITHTMNVFKQLSPFNNQIRSESMPQKIKVCTLDWQVKCRSWPQKKSMFAHWLTGQM